MRRNEICLDLSGRLLGEFVLLAKTVTGDGTLAF
jgi:hypothetical protein